MKSMTEIEMSAVIGGDDPVGTFPFEPFDIFGMYLLQDALDQLASQQAQQQDAVDQQLRDYVSTMAQ